MSKQSGKVITENGKFFVQVGRSKHLLEPGPLGGEESLKGLVGQEVQVVLSDPSPIAIIVKKVPVACYWHCFICYRPIDIFNEFEIDPIMRKANLETFFKEGLIDEKTFKQLIEKPLAF